MSEFIEDHIRRTFREFKASQPSLPSLPTGPLLSLGKHMVHRAPWVGMKGVPEILGGAALWASASHSAHEVLARAPGFSTCSEPHGPGAGFRGQPPIGRVHQAPGFFSRAVPGPVSGREVLLSVELLD